MIFNDSQHAGAKLYDCMWKSSFLFDLVLAISRIVVD